MRNPLAVDGSHSYHISHEIIFIIMSHDDVMNYHEHCYDMDHKKSWLLNSQRVIHTVATPTRTWRGLNIWIALLQMRQVNNVEEYARRSTWHLDPDLSCTELQVQGSNKPSCKQTRKAENWDLAFSLSQQPSRWLMTMALAAVNITYSQNSTSHLFLYLLLLPHSMYLVRTNYTNANCKMPVQRFGDLTMTFWIRSRISIQILSLGFLRNLISSPDFTLDVPTWRLLRLFSSIQTFSWGFFQPAAGIWTSVTFVIMGYVKLDVILEDLKGMRFVPLELWNRSCKLFIFLVYCSENSSTFNLSAFLNSQKLTCWILG